MLCDDAGKLHDSVIPLLPQEKQNVWYSSICKHNIGFVDEMKKWLSDAKRKDAILCPGKHR